VEDKVFDLFFTGLDSGTESQGTLSEETKNVTLDESSASGAVSSLIQGVQGREGARPGGLNPLLERHLRVSRTRGESLIQIPDSIVIVRPPRGVFIRMLLTNNFFRRVPALLLRRAIDQQTVLDVKRQCREIAERAWEDLASVYPFAYANSLTLWRHFNDSYDEKKLIILQKELEAYVVIPVIDEMGMLLTVLKHMCVVRRKLRQTVDVNIVETLRRVGDYLIKELDSVLERTRKS